MILPHSWAFPRGILDDLGIKRHEEILSHESVSSSDDPEVQLQWLSQRNIDWIRERLGKSWQMPKSTFWTTQQVPGNFVWDAVCKNQTFHTRNHGAMSYMYIRVMSSQVFWVVQRSGSMPPTRHFTFNIAATVSPTPSCMISWAGKSGNRATGQGVSTGLSWSQHCFCRGIHRRHIFNMFRLHMILCSVTISPYFNAHKEALWFSLFASNHLWSS